MAAALLFELHGGIFRELCGGLEQEFQGLGTVARLAKRTGRLPKDVAQKVERLDMVVAWLRHANATPTPGSWG